MIDNNFVGQLDKKITRLLELLIELPKDDIRDVKYDRGVFPQKIISFKDQLGQDRTKYTPFDPSENFCVFLKNDIPPGIAITERIGNKVYAQYHFEIQVVIYGSQSSFLLNQAFLRAVSHEVLEWMLFAEISWTELPGGVPETLDRMINNQWWLIRKTSFKLNAGIMMDMSDKDIDIEEIIREKTEAI